MHLTIETQPSKCRIAQMRNRSKERYYLTDEKGQYMKVAVCRNSGESIAGQLIFYAAVLTQDGENHPYRLQGSDCTDGVFSRPINFLPCDTKISVLLEELAVVSCSEKERSKVMEEKRKILSEFNVASPLKVTPQMLKTFRVGFYLTGLSSPAVTGFIQVVKGNLAESTQQIMVLETLPTEVYYSPNVASHKVAMLMGDSLADGVSVRRVECQAQRQDINIGCKLVDYKKHLLIVELTINTQLTAEHRCCVSIIFGINGNDQEARSSELTLYPACGRCKDTQASAVFQPYTPNEPEPNYYDKRRKQPTGVFAAQQHSLRQHASSSGSPQLSLIPSTQSVPVTLQAQPGVYHSEQIHQPTHASRPMDDAIVAAMGESVPLHSMFIAQQFIPEQCVNDQFLSSTATDAPKVSFDYLSAAEASPQVQNVTLDEPLGDTLPELSVTDVGMFYDQPLDSQGNETAAYRRARKDRYDLNDDQLLDDISEVIRKDQ